MAYSAELKMLWDGAVSRKCYAIRYEDLPRARRTIQTLMPIIHLHKSLQDLRIQRESLKDIAYVTAQTRPRLPIQSPPPP